MPTTTKPQPKPAAVPGIGGVDFSDPPPPRPRVVISSEGETKTGRSTFGFWAPDPIVHIDLDRRIERVVDRFTGGIDGSTPLMPGLLRPKVIRQIALKLPRPSSLGFTKADELRNKDEKERLAAEKLWQKFVRGYTAALESSLQPGGVRTVIIDTLTELYDLRILAEFGRLMGFRQRERGGANGDIIELIRMSEDYNANLLVIHQLKDEYAKFTKTKPDGTKEDDSAATGKRIIKGYKNLPYVTQAHLRHSYNEKKRRFEIEVDRCGTNADINKAVYTEEDWSGKDEESGEYVWNFGPFAWVAAQMTGTDPDEWMAE